MNKENRNKETERTTGDLQAISKSILPLAKTVLGKKGFVETDILTNWANIIGEDLADYTAPLKIDFKPQQRNNGILHLEVPSGAFALEIQHKEKIILQKINTYFGYNAVTSIRIIQNSEFKIAQTKTKPTSKTPPSLVTPEEENYIQELAEDINRPDLKEILIKLGQSVFNDNNQKEKKES